MKITIENHRGLLRLRWNDGTRRKTLALGLPDSPPYRAKAGMVKHQIEQDFHTGHYDPTLLKYKSRTIGKNATEISAPELFSRFTQHQSKEQGLAKSTVTAKYKVIEHELERYLNLPAIGITKQTAGKLTDIWERNIQSDTAKQRVWLLASCWDWAKGKYHIAEDNPWKNMAGRFKHQPRKRVEPFDADEVSRILKGFRNSPDHAHYGDFVAFLFGTGCRTGEAIGLRWENVAKDFSSVYISESVSKGVRGTTKTGESRTVALSPSMVVMFQARKESQPPNGLGLVFPSPNGKAIDRDNFRARAWTKVLKAAGVEYRKPYSTRHTAVSHALEGGANYLAVAKATGHSPHVMHQNYANSINKESVFKDFTENKVNKVNNDS
jgi:integrase